MGDMPQGFRADEKFTKKKWDLKFFKISIVCFGIIIFISISHWPRNYAKADQDSGICKDIFEGRRLNGESLVLEEEPTIFKRGYISDVSQEVNILDPKQLAFANVEVHYAAIRGMAIFEAFNEFVRTNGDENSLFYKYAMGDVFTENDLYKKLRELSTI